MSAFRSAVAFVAVMLVASSAWSAATLPSIEITGINTNEGCTDTGAEVNVILNTPIGNTHSDNYEIYNGGTLLYRWTGEVYTGVGPNTYGITNSGANVPADTIVTGVIYTFPTATNPPPPYTSSEYSYRSEIKWNCTTGAVVSITNTIGGTVASVTPIPTLRPAALAALALLLLGAGAWVGRRRA